MVTTFERLAKVLKGYVKPANWIERAFASIGGAVLPSVSGSDNGRILGVSAGKWAVVEPPKELPSVTSVDNGKVLGVDDGAWGVAVVPKELPTVTSDDKGKFLKANDSTGALEWASAGGGGGSTLYGPYMATVESATSIGIGARETVRLTKVFDSDYTECSYPVDAFYTGLISGINTGNDNAMMVEVFCKYGDDDGDTVVPYISLKNLNTSYTISPNPVVTFFSPVELTVASN